MKKIIVLLSVFFLAFQAFAQDDPRLQDAFSGYQPIYFVVGMGDFVKTNVIEEDSTIGEDIETRQWVKLGYSMKYQFFNQYNTGLYLGFTQTMFWDIFNESSPLSELNYNPDFFWRLQPGYNFLQDVESPVFDFLQLGVEHKSNGLAGTESRGFDRVYAQLQLTVGEDVSFSTSAKYYLFFQEFLPQWYVPEIDDYQDYRSNMEFMIRCDFNLPWAFFLPNSVVLEAAPGGGPNGLDFSMGYQQLHVVFGDIFSGAHPYLQIWNGYGEGLIAYDKSSLSIRAGVLLR